MTEEFNVNLNLYTGNLQGAEPLAEVNSTGEAQGIQNALQGAQGEADAHKSSSKNYENDLVVLDYTDSSVYASEEDNVLNQIQNERSEELDKYLEYQEKIAELQKEKSKYEEEIRQNKDNPETVRRYQRKLENLDAEIGEYQGKIAECEAKMQNLTAEFNAELSNMLNQNVAQSFPLQTQAAYSGGAFSSGAVQNVQYGQNIQGAQHGQYMGVVQGSSAAYASNAAQVKNAPSINYGAYVGETIPENLAKALDAKLGNGFSKKCEGVAGYLGCNVNDLLAMMYSESGLKTTARNKSSNAVGLIQFIPSTLQGNGYTTGQVASMSAVQQLDVIADIFMKLKRTAGYGANEKIDGGTLYAINWLPAYAKNNVVAQNGGKYYSSGLDMNKDGSVTKADLSQRLQSKYNEMLRYL